MMAIADIADDRKTQLVPYSFRHFAITNRVQSGLQLQEVAKMTGTSLKQVEETYWHLNEANRCDAAATGGLREGQERDYYSNDVTDKWVFESKGQGLAFICFKKIQGHF